MRIFSPTVNRVTASTSAVTRTPEACAPRASQRLASPAGIAQAVSRHAFALFLGTLGIGLWLGLQGCATSPPELEGLQVRIEIHNAVFADNCQVDILKLICTAVTVAIVWPGALNTALVC